MKYIVSEIIEPDFGCEGLPDGKEPECEVVLCTETGEKLSVMIPDKELYEKQITESSTVDYTNGILFKV